MPKRKLKWWERLLLPFIVAIFIPILLLITAPALVCVAIYAAIRGELGGKDDTNK